MQVDLYLDQLITIGQVADLNTRFYLDNIVALFKEELGENVLSIVLHGSLAMGCFNPKRSDIDFLVIVRKKLTSESIGRIAKKVLSLREQMPNEIEFSVILETHLKPFVYPTPIEFHYSDMHREKYLEDESYVLS